MLFVCYCVSEQVWTKIIALRIINFKYFLKWTVYRNVQQYLRYTTQTTDKRMSALNSFIIVNICDKILIYKKNNLKNIIIIYN